MAIDLIKKEYVEDSSKIESSASESEDKSEKEDSEIDVANNTEINNNSKRKTVFLKSRFVSCKWYNNYIFIILSLSLFLPIGCIILFFNKVYDRPEKLSLYSVGVFVLSLFIHSTGGNGYQVFFTLLIPVFIYSLFKVKGRYYKYALLLFVVFLIPLFTDSTKNEIVKLYLGLVDVFLAPIILFEVFRIKSFSLAKRFGVVAISVIAIIAANINMADMFKYSEIENAFDNDTMLMVEEEYTINGEEFSEIFDTAYDCWSDGAIENIGRVLVKDTVIDDATFKNLFLKDYNSEKMIAICSSDLEFTKNGDKSVKYISGFEYKAEYNDEKNIWMIGGYKAYTKN